MHLFESVLQDIRLAGRQLARHRGFSAIVLVTLALGIGVTATFFSILDAVTFRPLPFHDPGQLVSIHRTGTSDASRSRMAYGIFRDLEQQTTALASSVAYVPRVVTISGPGVAEQTAAADISGDLFGLLGVPLQAGRSLLSSDQDARVALISHDLWTQKYASNPEIVGLPLVVDGVAHTVVGVARSGFGFPADARIWLPLTNAGSDLRVEVVARLRPKVSVRQADAALRTVAADDMSDRRDGRSRTLAAVPLREVVLGTKHRDAALVLLAASALVLVVACANLAGLLLAHVSARRHEMAVRGAIGASRLRLVRQLMTESLILAVAGGLLGALLAQWGVDLFIATLGKPGGAEWMAFAVDGRVLLFAIAASLATALLFGVTPAIGGSRVDLRRILQEEGRSAGGPPRGMRLRGAVVAAQVALSLGVLAGGSSIVMSALAMADVHPGFDRHDLVTLRLSLSGPAYVHPEQRLAFVDAAVERIRGIAGVSGVTAVSHAPLVDRNPPATNFLVEAAATQPLPIASLRSADTGYMEVMRIPMRRGRALTEAEARDTHGTTIVINETLARSYWPDREAVGGRLRLPGAADPNVWFTVVGVAGDVMQRQLPAQPENQIYFGLAYASGVTLIVRADADLAIVARQARDAVAAVDPGVAVASGTMAGTYRAYARDRRLQGLTVGSLGVIALLVAALGVYGVMSLTVAERTREIAIRLALGCSSGAILRLVIGSGLKLTVAGIAAGTVLGLGATSFLSWIFFGLHPFDLRVFIGSAALLTAVALVACWWPARNAMRVEPMAVLKR